MFLSEEQGDIFHVFFVFAFLEMWRFCSRPSKNDFLNSSVEKQSLAWLFIVGFVCTWTFEHFSRLTQCLHVKIFCSRASYLVARMVLLPFGMRISAAVLRRTKLLKQVLKRVPFFLTIFLLLGLSLWAKGRFLSVRRQARYNIYLNSQVFSISLKWTPELKRVEQSSHWSALTLLAILYVGIGHAIFNQ